MSQTSGTQDHEVLQMRLQDPRTVALANGWPVYDHSNRHVTAVAQPLVGNTKRQAANYISDAYLYLVRLDGHLLLPGGLVTDGKANLFAHGLTYDLRPGRTDLGVLAYTKDSEPVQVAVPRQRRRIAGPAICLVGSYNFGHMLFEFLPRLFCMSFSKEVDDLPVIVSSTMPERFIEFLEIGGIRRERLVFHAPDEALQVDQLWLPSVPFGRASATRALYFSVPALNYLREKYYLPFRRDASHRRPRVYLNRVGAAFRRLVNEGEILPLLERHGFVVMDGVNQTARQQLDLITNAEAVFSQIGSSPTITMFAPADAYIVETCPDNVVGAFVGMAYAAMLTQPYGRIRGERVVLPDNSRPEPLYHDYRVNPEEVAAMLAQMQPQTGFLIF